MATSNALQLVPHLPAKAWVVLGGDALSGIGTGLTLPFLFIYLDQARHLGASTAGLALAVMSIGMFTGSPVSGLVADRVSARVALLAGLLASAGGALLVAGVRDAAGAYTAAAVVGLGFGAVTPAQDALLAGLVPEERRSAAFSVRHTTVNAGIGLGALVAAIVVRPDAASTFEWLYRVDAITFVLFVPVLVMLRIEHPLRSGHESERRAGGFRDVLADPTIRVVLVLAVVLMAAGFGQVGSGFAGYATRPGGVEPNVVALALAGNTIAVVGFQLFALRWLDGRTRTSGIRIVCLGFCASWALVLLGGQLGSGAGAAVAFVGALTVFGVAETAIPPTLIPMVNDLAPDDLRGRYNAVSNMSWTTGFFFAPLIAGPALGVGAGSWLFVGLIVALLAVAGGTRVLEQRVPPQANRISA